MWIWELLEELARWHPKKQHVTSFTDLKAHKEDNWELSVSVVFGQELQTRPGGASWGWILLHGKSEKRMRVHKLNQTTQGVSNTKMEELSAVEDEMEEFRLFKTFIHQDRQLMESNQTEMWERLATLVKPTMTYLEVDKLVARILVVRYVPLRRLIP